MKFIAALLCVMEMATSATAGLERTADGVRMLRNGHTLWSFSTSGGKPCVHPLCLPDGTTVTDIRPEDHPWHRGLWFSWKYLNGINYWETDANGRAKGEQRVTATDITCDGNAATVLMKVSWGARSEPFKPVITERRIVSFSPPADDGSYTIIWQADFTALEQTEIGRTPPRRKPTGEWGAGYAGFSLRLASAFASAANVHASCGANSQPEIIDRERQWLEYALRNHGSIRLEVIEAPKPTTFYHWPDHRFTSLSPVFGGNLTLERGQTLRLRYRVSVHGASGRTCRQQ